MSLQSLHTLLGMKVHPDSVGAVPVYLGGIQRHSAPTGINVVQEPQNGGVESQFQSLVSTAPQLNFTTYQISRAFGLLGAYGLGITSQTQTGLTFYGNKKLEGSVRASGSNHISVNIREGLMVPRRLSCDHRGTATLDVDTLVTYDGTNAPFVQTNGIALPTGLLDDQYFGMGPIQLATTAGDAILLTGKTRVDFDYGINASAESSDGDVHPTYATVDNAGRRVLRVTVLDVSLFTSSGIPLHGKEVDASHTVIFFRRKKKNSATGYEDDAALMHAAITPLAGCAYFENINEATNGGNAAAVIEIPFIGSSSAPAVSFSTDVAIALPS